MDTGSIFTVKIFCKILGLAQSYKGREVVW